MDVKGQRRCHRPQVLVDRRFIGLGPYRAGVIGRHALEEERVQGRVQDHADEAVVARGDLLLPLERARLRLDAAAQRGGQVIP